ncbi:MAG: glycosyltransferase family 8 protein, partial [Alphaproteobacteria bacterium]|nr:glycosyltransferase family 8 protein [Alphaproteobacteria bacterium]
KGLYMYKYGFVKRVSSVVAGLFGKTRAKRRLNRDKIRYKGLISTVSETRIPRQKYATKIPVAFCFDARGCKMAAVTIKSLLLASAGRCDYDIYCVINDDVDDKLQDVVRGVLDGTESDIHFVYGNHDFDESSRGKWPVAMWYRLMLPKLVPNVDRIIYADLDIIFFNDLIDIYEYDLGDNVIAAVPTRTNMYINSGFLLMDLKKIRQENIYDVWVQDSKDHDYYNPDQDVLNYTLKGRIAFLPLRYNFQLSHGSRIFKIYSESQLDDLKHNLVVLHYSDYIKPWSSGIRPVFSEYWWDVARKTGLFQE